MCVSVQEGDALLVHSQHALSSHVGNALQQSTKRHQPAICMYSVELCYHWDTKVVRSKRTDLSVYGEMPLKPCHTDLFFSPGVR